MIYIKVLPMYYMRNQQNRKEQRFTGDYFLSENQWFLNNLEKGDDEY